MTTTFGEALKKAVEDGKVPMTRLNDMDHRILRSMFAAGVIDYPLTAAQSSIPSRAAATRSRLLKRASCC